MQVLRGHKSLFDVSMSKYYLAVICSVDYNSLQQSTDTPGCLPIHEIIGLLHEGSDIDS